jgi:chromosomal replication initiator protein
LIIDIKHPDLETRKAIILKKCEEVGLNGKLEMKIIDYLAENIASNIRDIESAVNKLRFLSQTVQKEFTIEDINLNLSELLTPLVAQTRRITAEVIQREVANYYHISYSDMKSNKRTKDVSFPRQVGMYLSKEILKLSLNEIGNEFGGRDHSTVVASCKKVEEEIKNNPSIRNDYEALLKIFTEC